MNNETNMFDFLVKSYTQAMNTWWNWTVGSPDKKPYEKTTMPNIFRPKVCNKSN